MAENQQLCTEFRNLERKVGQMANNQNIRPDGALPSDTEKNPQVNAVMSRNGRVLVEVPKKKKEQSGLEEERVPKPVEVDERNKTESEQISERVLPPFPQRLRKKNDDHMFHKFLDMLKQIHLNIPLLDMVREVPKYEKYIKDIVENKRRLTEFETGALTEECTSRIQHKLPEKIKDPGSFTIPMRIREIDVGRALCDLGSNFIILDYEADELVPIILGRSLLATGDAIIKVREGKMTLGVDNEEAVFNVYRAIQLPRHYEDLAMISVVKINELAVEPITFKEDALEKALILFNHLELEEEVEEMLQILDASCEYIRERSQFEPLDRPIDLPPRPSEEKLLRVLREHKHAIGWTMSDIKGIRPAFYMHKIRME
ncbi:uncharacterized protein [Nicotiana tomentosiformis]|uniref:uncharacterized protein n=1 Tax=Nicotiana tomentosiformis TaxID=4098 RepID=UPI00388C4FD3